MKTIHDVDEPLDTTSARAPDIRGRHPFRIPFGSLSVSVDSNVNCVCHEFLISPLLHQQTLASTSYLCTLATLRLGS